MRGYKVTNNTVEPLSFVVPRKSDAFQSDIRAFASNASLTPTDPPALAGESALSAAEFFSGKTSEPKYVSLESKQSVAAPAKSAPLVASTPSTPARQTSVPTPASSAPALSTPTRHDTAPPKSTSSSIPPKSSSSSLAAAAAAPTAAAATTRAANASDDESTFPAPSPTPAAAASAVSASKPAVNGDSDLSALRKANEDLKVRLRSVDRLTHTERARRA